MGLGRWVGLPGVLVVVLAAGGSVPTASATAGPAGATLSVLQMNLCNSGMAGCYRGGRSVPEAAAIIAAVRPDAVTLNEICRGDLGVLADAMRRAHPGEVVDRRFQPVYGRDGSVPSVCVTGEQYGIGVLVHRRPGEPAPEVRGGQYPGQPNNRGEHRVWACVRAGERYVCVTHLSAFVRDRALTQCRYLLGIAVPAARGALGGYRPTVVAGDLNLTDRGRPRVGDCAGRGWRHTGDGGVQHVLATADQIVLATRRITTRWTDHPALLVRLRV